MKSIRGATVLVPSGPTTAHVHIANGELVDLVSDGFPIDATDHTIAPGFIDIQVNGGWGHDFTTDPGTIWDVGERLPESGVTSFVPTIVTSPYETYEEAMRVVAGGPPEGYSGADVIGLHFEGPWISPEWHGAHNPAYLRLPDIDVAKRWAAYGAVSIVTVAPELAGATEVAQVLADSGVVVSAGHTGANYETGSAALTGSWSAVTHLYNQMSPFGHRQSGMVGAALTSDAPCGLIVDGLHSDPGALQLAWTELGPDRTVLITDAMQATGLGPGTYLLGDQEVDVGPEGPRTADGRLAGSTLTMDKAVSNLAAWTSARFEEAIISATAAPARLLGLSDRGKIEVGLRADLVILDESNQIAMTIVAGDIVFERHDS